MGDLNRPPPSGGEFGSISLPILRRTFPKLMAEELVSVQPMNKVDFGDLVDSLRKVQERKFEEFFKEEEFNL
jgi:hypothetical protein